MKYKKIKTKEELLKILPKKSNKPIYIDISSSKYIIEWEDYYENYSIFIEDVMGCMVMSKQELIESLFSKTKHYVKTHFGGWREVSVDKYYKFINFICANEGLEKDYVRENYTKIEIVSL
jgi:hypothetical protein